MRKALNENPVVQIGALAALTLLVVIVFMSRMGGDPPPPAEPDSTATESTAAPAAGPAVTPTTPAAPPATDAAPPPPPAGAAPFEAGKGLPSDMVRAYESGDAVVLVVTQKDGIDDKPLASGLEALRNRSDTSVFVTDVKRVARYSRIAEGVSLDRVPAIIVLHPLEGKLAKGESAPLPEATLTYGFRGSQSVVQTVRDALYDGKVSGFDPG